MATTAGGQQIFNAAGGVLILPTGGRLDAKNAAEGQATVDNGELCIFTGGQWYKCPMVLIEERK
jgi:hypothetical protein